MPDEMVTIARFNFPVEAQMARLRLESEGIEAFIAGNAISQMVDPSGIYGIRLQVREEDAERAMAILAE